ncbi:MAG: GNAT family N-acetyltransferase [Erysipelotrichaceae bacterium]|nr:GNAT family N-acetyltransferase [Erysipelotrichaceae bacterium]MDD3809489.1 GNAT family N-acetyltransferase [Erysipelotrichaceae bacterium]
MELELLEFVQDGILGSYYIYLIKEGEAEIGRIVFRLGTLGDHWYDGHVGYTIKPEYRGQNKSLEACRLLKPLIEELGYDQVVLTCDPGNEPSKKIIAKLGGEHVETAPIPREQKKYFDRDEKIKEIYLWRLQ